MLFSFFMIGLGKNYTYIKIYVNYILKFKHWVSGKVNLLSIAMRFLTCYYAEEGFFSPFLEFHYKVLSNDLLLQDPVSMFVRACVCVRMCVFS